MPLKLLIIDSNTPEANADALAKGLCEMAAPYADCLNALEPTAEITVRNGYADEISDADFSAADGIVFTGSSVEWSVEHERAAPLRAVMRRAFAAGKPVFGSCNGAQLAAFVLGGRSEASPNGRELGLARDVQLTDAGKTHPMMRGRRSGFAVPCVHRDEITVLPEGAVLLAGNAHSPVQAFAYERDGVQFWGTQYHPEFTARYVGQLLAARETLFEGSVQMAAELMKAETSPEAAQALGVPQTDLQPEMRQSELRNWLAHLKGCAQ